MLRKKKGKKRLFFWFRFFGLFLILFYFLFVLITSIIRPKAATYQVTVGSLNGSNQYTGIVLRNESIYDAQDNGYISYSAREGSKVGVGNPIYTVGAQSNQDSDSEKWTVSSKDLSQLEKQMLTFSDSFDLQHFQETYHFQYVLENSILDLKNSQSASGTVKAVDSGYVLYNVDGYESLSESQISSSLFQNKQYETTNLREQSSVERGDSVYKLVSGYTWKVAFPLSKSEAVTLSDYGSLKVRFLADNQLALADFKILTNEDGYFGILSLQEGISRYLSYRYLEIELLLDHVTGLKIPRSAVSEKEFCLIPLDYAESTDSSNTQIHITRETFAADGSSEIKNITAAVYQKTDTKYYVNAALFQDGDYVLKQNSSDKYQVNEKKRLRGVYCVNRGYTIFNEITVLDENADYCIAEENSSYGLVRYDYIILNADTVKDRQLIY